jgi:hypothetical protein
VFVWNYQSQEDIRCLPKVDSALLAESLKGEVDVYVQAVMTDAPDRQWIAGSEEQVSVLSAG